MRLADLGERICIIGQSGSGKSTLADAIGRSANLPVVHLDQLRHVPGTRFELRSDAEFEALHRASVSADRWVMDGNYSAVWGERLERSTGLILLDISTPRSLARYVRRTLRSSRRIGGLGVDESLSWDMCRFIVRRSAANRRRRRALFDESSLPKLSLAGSSAVAAFHKAQGDQEPRSWPVRRG